MKDTIYLVLNDSGVRSMRKTTPDLRAGEYAVCVVVTVPDAYFERAIPTANLAVPPDYIMEPTVGVDLVAPDREPGTCPLCGTDTTTVVLDGRPGAPEVEGCPNCGWDAGAVR